MKMLIATLRLSNNTSDRTRNRCPDVVFAIEGKEVAAIRTDTEEPALPFADGELGQIEIRDDAISRVIDEAAWLEELARVLAPHGEIRLTLPMEGPLAWLDTMNIYRYMVDIGKRGHAPDASLPTGWNRHYPRSGVAILLEDAGFDHIRMHRTNYADREIGLLLTLLWRNWIKGDRLAEREAFPRFGSRRPGERTFPLGTTWSITARKRG